MLGHVASLNASVAGSILLYEASSQRGVERPPVVSIFAPDADTAPLAESTPDADAAQPAAEAAAPAAPAARKRRAKVVSAAPVEPVVEPSDAADGDHGLLPGASAAQPESDKEE
jgi:hypothetical protein